MPPKNRYAITPPQKIANMRARKYTKKGFPMPTSLSLEKRVAMPIEVNVNVKNITWNGVVPKVAMGAPLSRPRPPSDR